MRARVDMRAWRRPRESAGRRRCYAGLDLADGGANKCSLTDPKPARWSSSATGGRGSLETCVRLPSARTARHPQGPSLPVVRLSFDAVTSGMRAELTRVQTRAADGLPYGIRPVSFGGAVNGPDIEYEVGRPNKMVFARLNVQMADALRLRANRTVRMLNGDRAVDPMRCLFIRDDLPDLETYLEDLSRPIRRVSPQTGKWELEKAPDGTESPDDFDSTCLAFVRDTLKLRAR